MAAAAAGAAAGAAVPPVAPGGMSTPEEAVGCHRV